MADRFKANILAHILLADVGVQPFMLSFGLFYILKEQGVFFFNVKSFKMVSTSTYQWLQFN